MTCHTKIDRSTTPSRFVDQRYGVKEAFHEDMNYDGQGKSMQQETDDSLTMVVIVFVVALFLLLATFTAIYLGVTMVGQ